MYASLSSILSVFILVALVSARSIAYSKAKGSLQIAGTAEFEPEKGQVEERGGCYADDCTVPW
ncbi:hypothetical protein SCP_0113050 [Sparassis crispa]|uniref:Uncharacterized protein n=1 Tax=Sparassis crispa TaxID=139825 RepID=A0A401G8D9_9APHY|nr:hypothetical protein SCP_0113050 [Sparassis crispa]GBE78417.1 hypothetical protein SCP_0113050 [Sparassis crispa]